MKKSRYNAQGSCIDYPANDSNDNLVKVILILTEELQALRRDFRRKFNEDFYGDELEEIVKCQLGIRVIDND